MKLRISSIFFLAGYLMNIFVALIIIGSLISMTQLTFNIANASGSFSPTAIQFNATIEINNGGYYEIEDALVAIRVSNATHYVLAEENQSLGTIPLGYSTHNISLSVSLSKFFESRTYILNDSPMYMAFAISGKYALSLMSFYIEKEDSFTWDAPLDGLIYSISVTDYNSTHKEITVDYSFNSPGYEYGLNTTLIAMKDSSIIGKNTTLQLVPQNTAVSDSVSVVISDSGTITLEIIFNGYIFEISFEEEVVV